ncbi:MAG TPA: M56 family metallopeptidase, partial [Saprospiraceae bacterium]|nr:M56 family metallopeptidase [Saprospiraceae bacterium]
SLWQACCAALVLAWALSKYSQPCMRYRVAYGGLVAVLLAAVLTFLWLYEPGIARTPAVADSGNALFFSDLLPTHALPASIWADVVPALEARYPYLVTGWAVGCLLLLLRLLGAFWWVRRLRHRGLMGVGAAWQQRFEVLAGRMGVSGTGVRLFESAWVRVPVTVGHLKPLVLLPIGLLTHLSPAEVEAVLAHELAHIARRDWLFNLLQGLIESLFYYHPAIWWMSGVARREREACCDEQAVGLCGNPIQYAKVLVRVQELATPVRANQLVLGLDGGPVAPAARRRMLLLERVRRILHPPQHTSHNMEKTIATVGLLALLMFVGIRANTPQGIGSAFAQSSPLWGDFFAQNTDNQFVGDSLPRPKTKQRISHEDGRQRVEAEYEDGKVTRLNIDGKEIPAAEFSQHRALTDKMLSELAPPPAPPAPPGGAPMPPGMPAYAPPPPAPPVPPRLSTVKNADGSIMLRIENAEGRPVEIRVQNGETWVDGKKLAEGQTLDLPELGGFYAPEFHFLGGEWPVLAPLSEIEMAEALSDLPDIEDLPAGPSMREQRQIQIEQYKALEQARRDLEQQRRELNRDMKQQQRQMEMELRNAQRQQQAAMRDQERVMQQWHRDRIEAEARNNEAVAFWGHQLLSDGLITDPSHYSFVLTAKKMLVNGKKQSGSLRSKYCELYEQRTRGEFPLTDRNRISIDVR